MGMAHWNLDIKLELHSKNLRPSINNEYAQWWSLTHCKWAEASEAWVPTRIICVARVGRKMIEEARGAM